jgi:hypothetical protein
VWSRATWPKIRTSPWVLVSKVIIDGLVKRARNLFKSWWLLGPQYGAKLNSVPLLYQHEKMKWRRRKKPSASGIAENEWLPWREQTESLFGRKCSSQQTAWDCGMSFIIISIWYIFTNNLQMEKDMEFSLSLFLVHEMIKWARNF